MPHAALWVVQLDGSLLCSAHPRGFNAARGFVGGATIEIAKIYFDEVVSMPHAALWVVQQNSSII